MAKGPYTRHREQQRQTILEVAEDLFIRKGIELVTIADITKAARITRPTLYQYFPSKEEIAMEIFKMVTGLWAERDRKLVWSFSGNGYQRVERFVRNHFERLLEDPREAAFIAEFNYLYAKQWSSDKALEIICGTLGEEERNLRKAVEEGQADGSVRTDMEVELLVASIFNFNSGMMGRLGELGSKLDEEFIFPGKEIFPGIARLFLDGLKKQS